MALFWLGKNAKKVHLNDSPPESGSSSSNETIFESAESSDDEAEYKNPQDWLIASVWNNELRYWLKFYDKKSGKFALSFHGFSNCVNRILNQNSERIRQLQVRLYDDIPAMYYVARTNHKDSRDGGNTGILLCQVEGYDPDAPLEYESMMIELRAPECMGNSLRLLVKEQNMLLIQGRLNFFRSGERERCRVMDLTTFKPCWRPIIIFIISPWGLEIQDDSAVLLEIVERRKIDMRGILSLTYHALLKGCTREISSRTTFPEGEQPVAVINVPFFPVAATDSASLVFKHIFGLEPTSRAPNKVVSSHSLFCRYYFEKMFPAQPGEITIRHHKRQTTAAALKPILKPYEGPKEVCDEKMTASSWTISRSWKKGKAYGGQAKPKKKSYRSFTYAIIVLVLVPILVLFSTPFLTSLSLLIVY